MGEVKTWYEDQTLESQREFNQNKLHGTSLSLVSEWRYHADGRVEHNKLMKGSYLKKETKRLSLR
jgi:antitoxin component YwqK of YwqJK toxin-antitoxin module